MSKFVASTRVLNTPQSVIGSALKCNNKPITSERLYVQNTLTIWKGLVYWKPAPDSISTVQEYALEDSCHRYGAIEGDLGLLNAIHKKIQQVNNLRNKRVMVTPGSNAAFVSSMVVLTDPGDEVILFAPYFFNHEMSIRLTGAIPVVVPPNMTNYQSSPTELIKHITPKTKVVVLCNPSNPSGAVTGQAEVEEIQKICLDRGIWLISDEAYEDFVFDGQKHYSPDGPNVINLYTMSKGSAMAVYPPYLDEFFGKTQDSFIIHASHISQKMAETMLHHNREVLRERVNSLQAFYFLIKLPNSLPADKWVQYISEKHNVRLGTNGSIIQAGIVVILLLKDFV
ncbi:L-aspartate aminotransferase apoenzyme [Planoprotostelium fungivorum]|uniref:L-aspartate aminotransferase apoenzyme n=1 Tax=Planoprotostelium fungivorum TaxID=1890364 RepID=A0A2P6P0E9_9EUKA|nr:L-aspartate aminotransferase apoenzyme [Planoprotostelium fungivorum]